MEIEGERDRYTERERERKREGERDRPTERERERETLESKLSICRFIVANIYYLHI